jgi:hypothetical protein
MTDPVLRKKFTMHARLQGGSAYYYDLIDEAEKVVGSYSVTTQRKRGVKTTKLRYLLGSGPDAQEYETPLAFMTAYKLKLRDEEFDAAAPKGKTDDR